MQLTPKEGYAMMQIMVDNATGVAGQIAVVDTSSFVAAGETVLRSGKENVLNSLSYVVGETYIRVQSIDEEFTLINEEDESLYNQLVREILFYDDKTMPAGNWNTYEPGDNPTGYINLANGYDNGSNSGNSVASQWEQRRKECLELNFCGMVVWDYGITLDADAFKVIFTDVNEFTRFVSGILTEVDNDIKMEKNGFRRMVFLNRLAEAINGEQSFGTAVNLTYEYNQKFGTQYTSEQLRTTYLKSFLEFMTSYIKTLSRRMRYKTKLYHNPYTKTNQAGTVEKNILMNTPRDQQLLALYQPLINDAESQVMPEIFNPEYLEQSNYMSVDYWQNFNNPAAIYVTPATVVDGVQTAGDTVNCPYIVGAIWHRWAVRTGTFMDSADTTPLEARKRYRNMWWHIAKKSYDNMAYPFITLYMADPVSPEPEPGPEETKTTRKTSK